MSKRTTRRAAIGCIVAGTLISGAETFGMTNLRSHRKTDISTAEDSNALLGIERASDATSAAVFENRSDGRMSVHLEADESGVSFDDEASGEFAFDLASSERREIDVSSTNGSEVDVDVTADLIEDGATVGTVELRRTFVVSPTNRLESSGAVRSPGQSGKLEFELTNVSDTPLEIVAIGIRKTTNERAESVDDGDILTVDGIGRVVADPIPIDSEESETDTRREFEQPVSIPADGTREFEFDKFRRGGAPPNANMSDEDVRTTLYFEDGSSETVWLRGE
jgi:hypothetical protein